MAADGLVGYGAKILATNVLTHFDRHIPTSVTEELIHRDRDEITVISQTTFSNAFLERNFICLD